jgi:hypothetical protein
MFDLIDKQMIHVRPHCQRGELYSTSLPERCVMFELVARKVSHILIAKEVSHVRPHCQTDESCSTSLPYR